MQLEKISHIGQLIWRKYQIDKVLLGLILLYSIGILNLTWVEVTARIDLNIPFTKAILPSYQLFLSGWQVMGFFAWAPFALLPFFFYQPLKKAAFPVTFTLICALFLHASNLSQAKNILPVDDSGLLVVDGAIFAPLYLYFLGKGVLLILSFFVSKQA
jgi:hypothetical protein